MTTEREFALVRDCAGLDSAAVQLLDDELDWDRVLAFAQRHRLRALLARGLAQHDWRGVPDLVRESLTSSRERLAARNLVLTGELLRIVELLERQGITVVPYKGPLLALAAYGDISVRPFSDLDVLVAHRDAARAKALLLTEGYRSKTPAADRVGARPHPADSAFELMHDGKEVMVEIHWRFASWCALTFDDVIAAATRTRLLRGEVNDLSPADAVLMLCVHGHNHGWPRLEPIAALAHLVTRHPDLDWSRVESTAATHGATAALSTGLALAHRVFRAAVPTHLRARMDVDALVAALFDAAAVTRSVRSTLRRDWHNHRGRARLRFLAGKLHPSERDYAFVRLPARAAWLYYAVRPVRAVAEYAGARRVR